MSITCDQATKEVKRLQKERNKRLKKIKDIQSISEKEFETFENLSKEAKDLYKSFKNNEFESQKDFKKAIDSPAYKELVDAQFAKSEEKIIDDYKQQVFDKIKTRDDVSLNKDGEIDPNNNIKILEKVLGNQKNKIQREIRKRAKKIATKKGEISKGSKPEEVGAAINKYRSEASDKVLKEPKFKALNKVTGELDGMLQKIDKLEKPEGYTDKQWEDLVKNSPIVAVKILENNRKIDSKEIEKLFGVDRPSEIKTVKEAENIVDGLLRGKELKDINPADLEMLSKALKGEAKYIEAETKRRYKKLEESGPIEDQIKTTDEIDQQIRAEIAQKYKRTKDENAELTDKEIEEMGFDKSVKDYLNNLDTIDEKVLQEKISEEMISKSVKWMNNVGKFLGSPEFLLPEMYKTIEKAETTANVKSDEYIRRIDDIYKRAQKIDPEGYEIIAKSLAGKESVKIGENVVEVDVITPAEQKILDGKKELQIIKSELDKMFRDLFDIMLKERPEVTHDYMRRLFYFPATRIKEFETYLAKETPDQKFLREQMLSTESSRPGFLKARTKIKEDFSKPTKFDRSAIERSQAYIRFLLRDAYIAPEARKALEIAKEQYENNPKKVDQAINYFEYVTNPDPKSVVSSGIRVLTRAQSTGLLGLITALKNGSIDTINVFSEYRGDMLRAFNTMAKNPELVKRLAKEQGLDQQYMSHIQGTFDSYENLYLRRGTAKPLRAYDMFIQAVSLPRAMQEKGSRILGFLSARERLLRQNGKNGRETLTEEQINDMARLEGKEIVPDFTRSSTIRAFQSNSVLGVFGKAVGQFTQSRLKGFRIDALRLAKFSGSLREGKFDAESAKFFLTKALTYSVVSYGLLSVLGEKSYTNEKTGKTYKNPYFEAFELIDPVDLRRVLRAMFPENPATMSSRFLSAATSATGSFTTPSMAFIMHAIGARTAQDRIFNKYKTQGEILANDLIHMVPGYATVRDTADILGVHQLSNFDTSKKDVDRFKAPELRRIYNPLALDVNTEIQKSYNYAKQDILDIYRKKDIKSGRDAIRKFNEKQLKDIKIAEEKLEVQFSRSEKLRLTIQESEVINKLKQEKAGTKKLYRPIE